MLIGCTARYTILIGERSVVSVKSINICCSNLSGCLGSRPSYFIISLSKSLSFPLLQRLCVWNLKDLHCSVRNLHSFVPGTLCRVSTQFNRQEVSLQSIRVLLFQGIQQVDSLIFSWPLLCIKSQHQCHTTHLKTCQTIWKSVGERGGGYANHCIQLLKKVCSRRDWDLFLYMYITLYIICIQCHYKKYPSRCTSTL